ncbi:prepilin-type N-terminal cleavage/methylation domain-containing protein, partial [Acidovorax cavernicola]
MLVNRRRQPPRARLGGFTLIELMTTVSVLAVLVALALP